jgi:hypothetical protein
MRRRGLLYLVLVYALLAGGMGAVHMWHNPVTLAIVLVLIWIAVPGLAWKLRIVR